MNNFIKKIILSRNEKKEFIGIVVIRNKSIEKYGYGEISNHKLLELYSKFVLELSKNQKKELENLDGQESVDQLYKMGMLEYSQDDLITSIVVKKYIAEERLIISRLSGTEIVKSNDYSSILLYQEFKSSLIKEIENTYNISFSDMQSVGLYIDEETKIKQLEEKHKIKKLVLRDISWILASGIAITGLGIGMSKISKKSENKSDIEYQTIKPYILNTPSPTISSEPSVFPTFNDDSKENFYDATNTPTIVPEVTPTLAPTLEPRRIRFQDEDKIFGSYYEDIDSDILGKMIVENKDDFYKKNVGFPDLLFYLNKIRVNNMKYLVGKSNDYPNLIYVYYDNDFSFDNLKDKAFVRYFSMLSNLIVKNANNKLYNDNVDFQINEAIRLLIIKEPLKVYLDGKEQNIYFDELGEYAKSIVLDIIWASTFLIKSDEIYYNDEIVSKFKLCEFIIESRDPRNEKSMFTLENGKFDEVRYKTDILFWKSMLLDLKMEYEDYFNSNSNIKDKMIEKYGDYFDSYEILSEESNRDDIINNYQGNNPFKSRFSQGNGGYGRVKFEGSTIRKSGCGICAFATGISCGLTLEYDTNISINPKILLELLNSLPDKHYYRGDNGLIYTDKSSNISIDITEAFSDISIIELESTCPTFNTKQLEMITNNYPVVLSLNGRGHIVCVTSNNRNEKFYVSDSDRGYSDPISLKTYIVRSDGRKKGTISGKKAWIIIPNKNITINGNEIEIQGLDLSLLPKIGSFQTNGKSFTIEINKINNTIVIPENQLIEKKSNGIKK